MAAGTVRRREGAGLVGPLTAALRLPKAPTEPTGGAPPSQLGGVPRASDASPDCSRRGHRAGGAPHRRHPSSARPPRGLGSSRSHGRSSSWQSTARPPPPPSRTRGSGTGAAGGARPGPHRPVPGAAPAPQAAPSGAACRRRPALPHDPAVGGAGRVVSRGIPWRRRAARWAWSRARRRSLRRQRFEPRRLRERERERRRGTVRFRASGAGLGTRSITPSAVAMVANQRTPTSTPTLEAGSGWPGLGAPHEAGLGTPSERAPMGNPRGAPLRAIVLERGHRPGRPMGGGTPAVVPGTEAAQELAYVSDQVLVDLGGIDLHQPLSLSGEGSFHLLGPEPHEAAPRLDHDRGHGRVT